MQIDAWMSLSLYYTEIIRIDEKYEEEITQWNRILYTRLKWWKNDGDDDGFCLMFDVNDD